MTPETLESVAKIIDPWAFASDTWAPEIIEALGGELRMASERKRMEAARKKAHAAIAAYEQSPEYLGMVADARRYQYVTTDIADRDERAQRNRIIENMAVKSKNAMDRDVDLAINS